MATVFKRARCLNWRIRYKNAAGKRVEVDSGFRQKAHAVAHARKLEKEAEDLRARGLTAAPGADSYLETVDRYLQVVKAKGRAKDTLRNKWNALRILGEECGFYVLADINRKKVTEWADRRIATEGQRTTASAYYRVLRTFLSWAVKRDLLPNNPLTGMDTPEEIVVSKRRPFTQEELRALVEKGCRRRKRALIYLLAAYSGLRYNELRLLQPCDYTLPEEDKLGVWHLRPEITKAKRKDVIPMSPEAAEVLKEAHRDKLILKPPPRNLFAADLQRVDTSGRLLVFHSLRYYFCGRLAKVMLIQHVKRLMRHSMITETADLYAELGFDDLSEAIGKFPPLGI